MRMVEDLVQLICKLFGHKPELGPLERSPYTVYTHRRDITCSRCGAYIGHCTEYHDALTEPQLFQPDKAIQESGE